MSGEQDMRKMGGLKAKMPKTHLTMLVGCIAIAGIPPLAGFFSKDEILWSAFKIGTSYGRFVWAVGLVAAAMTAFYMFRLYHMTFSGSFRGGHEVEHHVHESPATMTVPLQVLALGSILAGFLGVPAILGGNAWFEHFLHPVFADAHHALEKVFTAEEPGHGLEFGLMVASVAIAAFGIMLATRFYKAHPEIPERLAASFATAHRVLTNKYYVDELYGKVFVRGLALGGGNTLFATDRFLVDGGDGQVRPGFGVNGLAWLSRDIVARLSNFWDRWIVDGSVNLLAAILDNLSYLFRAVQNGQVQNYALSALIGLFLLIGLVGRYMLGLY
jgi:NADH-quinone oxidoreductase subunit L